jgi:hypothetical protein
MHLLLDTLAAFGAEAQTNGLAVDRVDLSSVAAPRVPRSRAYCSLPGRMALRATRSMTAASVKARVGSLAPR